MVEALPLIGGHPRPEDRARRYAASLDESSVRKHRHDIGLTAAPGERSPASAHVGAHRGAMAASHTNATIPKGARPDATNSDTATPTRGLRRAALAAVLLGGTALGGFAVGHVAAGGGARAQPVNPPAAQAQQAIPDFVDLVKQVKPAVVSVTTKLAARTPPMRNRPVRDRSNCRSRSISSLRPDDAERRWRRPGRRSPRLRFHHRRQRHDRHQQPCG